MQGVADEPANADVHVGRTATSGSMAQPAITMANGNRRPLPQPGKVEHAVDPPARAERSNWSGPSSPKGQDKSQETPALST